MLLGEKKVNVTYFIIFFRAISVHLLHCSDVFILFSGKKAYQSVATETENCSLLAHKKLPAPLVGNQQQREGGPGFWKLSLLGRIFC